MLRLEKYPHRINFAKGIVECRKQTYHSLRKIVKTIPLDTPTTIELCPGYTIRVTLLDANHCIGAVMFLIQGTDGTAIIYTGDIRAEPWWVNAIAQNPVLIPYTFGPRRLEKIYLDTTFATKSNPYREFSSKADGINELLTKMANYPADTVFHFQAWTFGYENVWVAMSAALQTPIHLDPYRWRLYRSIAPKAGTAGSHEAPPLCGFVFGNSFQEGCLTSDHTVRLHSCEKGNTCPIFDKKSNAVQIIPIVNRLRNGLEIPELGAGGGKGDLDQIHELELDDKGVLSQLMALCASEITTAGVREKVLGLLSSASDSQRSRIRLQADRWKAEAEVGSRGDEDGDIPLKKLVSLLVEDVEERPQDPAHPSEELPLQHPEHTTSVNQLPDVIVSENPCYSSYSLSSS